MIHHARKTAAGLTERLAINISFPAVILILVTSCQTVPESSANLVDIQLPGGHPVTIRNSPTLSLSPDGKLIAFVADIEAGEGRQLMLLSVNGEDARFLPGTRDGETPFFSPDSQWIGFFAENKLKKISLTSNKVEVITDAVEPKGGFWGKDNTIVYSTGSIWRVDANGGSALRLTRAEQDEQHYWPSLTTDSTSLIYNNISANDASPDVVLLDIDSGRQSTLIANGNYPRFMGPGQLLFVDNGMLKSVNVNLDTHDLESQPTNIRDNVLISPNTGAGQYSVSDDGGLVYIEGRIFGSSRKVVYLDDNGNETDPGFPLARNSYVRYSTDGSLIAIESEPDVLVYDAEDKSLLYRIENASYPVWGPGEDD
ncbi:MAG: hypothetical protein HKN08_06155, partial [Gammaproteobacteria bacterium]|nr:hypothetical protein [Gammaproteobacteria bacterium]